MSYGVDCMFHCGGCSALFSMIWQLHEHLQLHTPGGSYHYDHHTRTAFPKYDTTCHQTQTDLECNEKGVNLVCSETQTEDILISSFNNQEDCEKESDEENEEENVTVKRETSESPPDVETGENAKSGDLDNDVKVPILTPDDPYSGDTDEGSNHLYPDSDDDGDDDDDFDDDDYVMSEHQNNAEQSNSLVNNIISNMKTFNSKSIKNTAKEPKPKEHTKKSRLRTNKKETLKEKKRKGKKKDYLATKKAPIQCKHCSEVFPNSLHMKRHCLREHPLEKNYKCKYCDEAFVTEAEITKHRKLHLREKYQCHICKKRLSSTQNLQDHITVHTGEKLFECKDCGTYFR